jgi:hypothetical protein
MFEGSIPQNRVFQAVQQGEVMRECLDDQPYPSRLFLHLLGDDVLHVVAADLPDEAVTVIITVYRPDPRLWTTDFRRKRQP